MHFPALHLQSWGGIPGPEIQFDAALDTHFHSLFLSIAAFCDKEPRRHLAWALVFNMGSAEEPEEELHLPKNGVPYVLVNVALPLLPSHRFKFVMQRSAH